MVSAVSAWEIALKHRLGKLEFDTTFLSDFDARIGHFGFEPLALTSPHMVRGAQLESPHKDPFDRMLAGQALIENLTLVTKDAEFKSFGVSTIW